MCECACVCVNKCACVACMFAQERVQEHLCVCRSKCVCVCVRWDCTATVGSSGKTFSITGWKCGWVVGPADIVG